MSFTDQFNLQFDPNTGQALGYNQPIFTGPPAVDPNAAANPPAAQPPAANPLSGQTAAGPLSGTANAGGPWWQQQWVGPTAAALLGGRTFRDSLAGASNAIAQTMPGELKRQALNAWLQAKSAAVPDASGNVDPQRAAVLNAAQTHLFQVDPELAQNVANFQMTPHPMTIQQVTATGDVLGIDPYGVNPPKLLYSARQAATGGTGGGTTSAATDGSGAAAPTGLDPAMRVADPTKLDRINGEPQTIKQNDGSEIQVDKWGRWAVSKGPEPTPEQTKGAGAAALARSAQTELAATEPSQSGDFQSFVRHVSQAGGFVTHPWMGPEARQYIAARASFMEAIRGYAQGKGLSPEDPRFAEETFFAPDHATPEELATAAAHREAMIHEMEISAGPYAQPTGAAGPTVQEGQTARNPATGHVIVVKGGQWVDAQTGQPVQ